VRASGKLPLINTIGANDTEPEIPRSVSVRKESALRKRKYSSEDEDLLAAQEDDELADNETEVEINPIKSKFKGREDTQRTPAA
jgi:hypothetical protein